MYEFRGFTQKANKALNLSIESAQNFGHDYIGTEHILLGLIKEGSGVAAAALEECGVTAEALEKAGSVEKVAGKWFQVSFGYEAMNSVMKILKDMDLRQQGQNFGSECSLRTWVRLSAENDFRSRMEKVENCHINEL